MDRISGLPKNMMRGDLIEIRSKIFVLKQREEFK